MSRRDPSDTVACNAMQRHMQQHFDAYNLLD